MIRFVVFWLTAVVWLAVALPILLWSFMTLEVPLWPDFQPDATIEGKAIWAAVAAFFYITPVVLLLNKKAGHRPSKMLVANAQD